MLTLQPFATLAKHRAIKPIGVVAIASVLLALALVNSNGEADHGKAAACHPQFSRLAKVAGNGAGVKAHCSTPSSFIIRFAA